MSNGLVDTTLLGPPALTESGSPVVDMGNVYWRLLLDGEGEHAVDVAEVEGEGICGVSRDSAATSFNVGDLWEGRSL
jgi:hypothetical protein